MEKLQNHPKMKNRAVNVTNWKDTQRIVDYLNINGFKTASGRDWDVNRLMEIASTRNDVDAGILVILADEGMTTNTKVIKNFPMEYLYTIVLSVDEFMKYVETLKN